MSLLFFLTNFGSLVVYPGRCAKKQQRLTPVALVMAVLWPPRCIAACSWSFVLILYYFVYLDVRARMVCARPRKYVFARLRTN